MLEDRGAIGLHVTRDSDTMLRTESGLVVELNGVAHVVTMLLQTAARGDDIGLAFLPVVQEGKCAVGRSSYTASSVLSTTGKGMSVFQAINAFVDGGMKEQQTARILMIITATGKRGPPETRLVRVTLTPANAEKRQDAGLNISGLTVGVVDTSEHSVKQMDLLKWIPIVADDSDHSGLREGQLRHVASLLNRRVEGRHVFQTYSPCAPLIIRMAKSPLHHPHATDFERKKHTCHLAQGPACTTAILKFCKLGMAGGVDAPWTKSMFVKVLYSSGNPAVIVYG